MFAFFFYESSQGVMFKEARGNLWSLALSRASDRSRKKKSNFVGVLGTNSWKNRPILRESSNQ